MEDKNCKPRPNMGRMLGIPADDIHEGQYVSIVKNQSNPRYSRPTISRNADGEISFAISECTCESEDDSDTAGVPHRVMAISWPWAALAILCPGGNEAGPRIIDVRTFTLMRLNEDYIQAIKNFSAECDV